MKCLGVLGTVSTVTAEIYERHLHREVRRRLGPTGSANLVIRRLESILLNERWRFAEWRHLGIELSVAAKGLVAAGAEAILLDSSTLHVAAGELDESIGIPFFHLADATADSLARSGIGVVGLLGTRCRPEEEFWTERLRIRTGIELVLPTRDDRAVILGMLEELAHSRATEASRVDLLRIMKTLKRQMVRAFVIVAPELMLLVDDFDPRVRVIDAAQIHAALAIRWSCGESGAGLPAAPCEFAL